MPSAAQEADVTVTAGAAPTRSLHVLESKKEQSFAQRLEQQMQLKGLTQSALAREIWGSTKDTRGYSVARNRDRISAYLAGAGMPEPENLQKIVDVLGCTIEDLIGEGAARPVRRAPQVGAQLATLLDRPNWMQVNINMVLPMARALSIMQIIQNFVDEQDAADADGEEDEAS